MRRNDLLAAVTLASLALAAPATAGAPFNADPLTVSGRFDAPRAADGPMKANIAIAQVTVPGANADVLGAKPDVIQPTMTTALQRSMNNFGYLAPGPDARVISITVEMDPYEVTADKDAVSVTARMRLRAEGPDADCVPQSAEAKFRALAPLTAMGNQRKAAWVAVIGLAALGVDASVLAADQLRTAAASDAAVNGRRERTEFEAVAPDKSAKGMARFAAVNASQLAAADLIRQLGKSACPARANPGPA